MLVLSVSCLLLCQQGVAHHIEMLMIAIISRDQNQVVRDFLIDFTLVVRDAYVCRENRTGTSLSLDG